MADTTLSIGIEGGREAKTVVDLVTVALRSLGQQQAANARQTKQQAQTARENATQLRGLANAAKSALVGQEQILAQVERKAKQSTRFYRDATTAAVDNARAVRETTAVARASALAQAEAYKKASIEATAFILKQKEAALAVANQPRTATTRVGGKSVDVTLPPDRELVKVREREVTEAHLAVAEAKRIADEKIASAKRVGSVQRKEAADAVIAARKEQRAVKDSTQDQVENQNRIVTVLRRIMGARNQTASNAERTAAAEERASRRATQAMLAHDQVSQKLHGTYTRLRNAVVSLVAAYAGFRVLEKFVGTGLKFNETIESAKLGIGALITAEADLIDKHGDLLEGTKALSAAQTLAGEQLNKLRIAGIQTAATTEDLVTAFEEAVGAGVAVGLTLDQIRNFTVQVAQAASAINLPSNQLQQETRSILAGTIDRNSRIAKALQLTNEQVNLAKQQNRLADLLNEKFRAFTIAGVESVKTFAALKSNIQDAFSVLAGQATEGLFERLRDAGQAALAQIFDFKTAGIQQSFRGLVEGAQLIFDEIGRALADALALAVEKGKAISRFLEDNREKIKKTAAAVGTMVRAFEEMLRKVVAVATGVSTVGDRVNPIIGLARVLTSVFEAIGDNIGKIALLLGVGGILTALGAVLGLVVKIRTAVSIGAVFAGGGIPGAIAGIVALLLAGATAYNLFKNREKEARLETARMTSVLQDQRTKASGLARQYIELQQAAKAKGITDEEQTVLQSRLDQVYADLVKVGGPAKEYLRLIKDGTLANQENTASIRDRMKALHDQQAVEATAAFFEKQSIQNRVNDLEAQKKSLRAIVSAPASRETVQTAEGTVVLPDVKREEAEKNLIKVNDALEVTKTQLQTADEHVRRLNRSFQETADLLNPATIKAHNTDDVGNASERRIAQARAELERSKQELDNQRAQVNNQLALHIITGIEQITRIKEIDLAEIEAERKFLEARKVEARRQLTSAKKGSEKAATAQDVLKSIDIDERRFQSKRIEIEVDADNKILKARQELADRQTEIQIRLLRVQGKFLEAAQAEANLKGEQALRQLEDTAARRAALVARRTQIQSLILVGLQLNPADLDVINAQLAALDSEEHAIKLVVTAEGIKDQVTSIQQQIESILTTRTREVEAINSKFKQSGDLSAKEKQDKATAIEQANKRALDKTVELRAALVALREIAVQNGLPTMVIDIDRLVAGLDALKVKAEEVDVEMEKLRDGLRNALEGGLSGFLEGLGDKTKTLADLFKDMVNSILKDMQRLIAQVLASRIVQALFNIGVAAASGGAQRGNTTAQGFSGRAEGGPGRPAHGRLAGGTPGQDSIPILAMPDEWFLQREVRRVYGDRFLQDLNELKVPLSVVRNEKQIITHQTRRFAQGGPVNRIGGVPGDFARQTVPQDVNLVVSVNRKGLLDVWAGPVGKSVVKAHVQNSHREFSRLLSSDKKATR